MDDIPSPVKHIFEQSHPLKPPNRAVNMQFKIFALASLAMSTLAAATPLEARTGQCATGTLQCCNSLQKANSPSIATLLGLLGIAVQDVTAEVGVTCSPITVVGTGGTSCSAQSVCCTNDGFNGVVALGCTPINANL